MISNDAIAERAQKLAKADGVVVWQREKYINAARKQLELEADEALAAAVAKRGTTKPFSDAELEKATMEADERIARRAGRCV